MPLTTIVSLCVCVRVCFIFKYNVVLKQGFRDCRDWWVCLWDADFKLMIIEWTRNTKRTKKTHYFWKKISAAGFCKRDDEKWSVDQCSTNQPLFNIIFLPEKRKLPLIIWAQYSHLLQEPTPLARNTSLSFFCLSRFVSFLLAHYFPPYSHFKFIFFLLFYSFFYFFPSFLIPMVMHKIITNLHHPKLS